MVTGGIGSATGRRLGTVFGRCGSAVLLCAMALLGLAGCDPSMMGMWSRLAYDEGTACDPVPIQVNVPYEGSIGESGESWYEFAVATRGECTIALTNTKSNLDIYLYQVHYSTTGDDECPELWWLAEEHGRPSAHDEALVCSLEGGGTYVVWILNREPIAGTFTITISVE